MKRIAVLIILSISLISNALAIDKKLVDILKQEIKRTKTELSKENLPPYFISYYLLENQKVSMQASFGKINHNNFDKYRFMDIEIRVGSHKFDNTHIIRGNPFDFSATVSKIPIPFESDEYAIKNAIWYATDQIYKNAIQRYEKALTNQAVKVAEEDTSDDFSRENAIVDLQDWQDITITNSGTKSSNSIPLDTAKWAAILRKVSTKFNSYKWLHQASVSFSFEINNKLIINTDGFEVSTVGKYARVSVYIQTKADDGMSLPLFHSYFGFSPDELPSEQEIARKIDEMIATLDKLRNAPLAETFSGPAILSGEAAGVFFHEIFGHRVEGHREKDPTSSQTFKNSIDKKILPEFLNVVFDPTIAYIQGKPVSGYYKYDDEGILGQRVETVKNGIFSNFLMSRIPIQNFPNSNGHGRKQIGYQAISRQSNLIVEATQTFTKEELRQKLIEEAKKQNKEYGLFFDKVSGGFTFTTRYVPNSFNVTPIIVYKVYVDGRPDELVRGVDLIGTPLTTFSNVVAAADDIGIFNGICGAESGGVPVSAVSPSLLVSKIEVQKKVKSQAKPPILEAPNYEAISQ
jgi:predicted Zn-dependent protease